MVVGIYEWLAGEHKHRTWELMRSLRNIWEAPMVFFGDFNEIASMTEKDGGAVRSERKIDAFRGVIDDCGLRDLGYRGSIFTWQWGVNPGDIVRERLDRFLDSTD